MNVIDQRPIKNALDCPFCGMPAPEYAYCYAGFYVRCRYCGAQGPIDKSQVKALEMYNSRAIKNELLKKQSDLLAERLYCGEHECPRKGVNK